LTSLRVGWIPVAAAFSGSASPTVDEQLSFCPFRVTNKKPKSEKNSTRITIMVESDQTKYCTEGLKRPISLKFYRNFTSVTRQRNTASFSQVSTKRGSSSRGLRHTLLFPNKIAVRFAVFLLRQVATKKALASLKCFHRQPSM